MRKVGFERDTYAEKRQFLGTIAEHVDFIRVASRPNGKFPALLNGDERYQSSFVDDDRVDFVHYFNQINYGKTPYITTYETCVPRYWNKSAFIRGCREIVSDKCLKIIAMCNNAHLGNDGRMNVISDADKDIIRSKSMVLHPPQEIVKSDLSRFNNIDPLQVVFVGGDFYIKGGCPCLLALKLLVDAGYKINMTIIGDVRNVNWNYNIGGATEGTVKAVLQFIDENRRWVNWIPSLPNEKVLELLAHCHLGLLPSFAETYGYVVLEMQAAGVPVITTDIRAFPEINPDDCGWKIRLPKISKDKLHLSHAIIKNSIVLIVKEIFEHAEVLAEKSKASQARIRRDHSPERHAEVLQKIYTEAL